MERRKELVSDLKGWCRGEALDEAHAVMVLIREDVDLSAMKRHANSEVFGTRASQRPHFQQPTKPIPGLV